MSRQFCPECGHENPAEARYCMNCGHTLGGEPAPSTTRPSYPAVQQDGTDWASIVAAILAFLSLRRMSRKARQTTIVLTVLLLFFGCPMVCGFAAFAVESITKMFH